MHRPESLSSEAWPNNGALQNETRSIFGPRHGLAEYGIAIQADLRLYRATESMEYLHKKWPAEFLRSMAPDLQLSKCRTGPLVLSFAGMRTSLCDGFC